MIRGEYVGDIHSEHAKKVEDEAIVTTARERNIPILSMVEFINMLQERLGSNNKMLSSLNLNRCPPGSLM